MFSKKDIRKLNQKKYREESGCFLMEGVKVIEEILKEGVPTETILISEAILGDKYDRILSLLDENGRDYEPVNKSEMEQMTDTKTSPGVMAVLRQFNWTLDSLDYTLPIIVLNGISDPGNMGTIIRTADWFGITQVIISESSVDIYNPKVVRSTMGSILRAKLVVSTDIVQDVTVLKNSGYRVVGLDMKGQSTDNMTKVDQTVYVIGSESHGPADGLRVMMDEVYTIQGRGGAESLNVAVATGILFSKI
jgi:RNA methyltransferase, TrmH family